MTRILPRTVLILILGAFLAACGDQSLFMSLKSTSSEMQISSATDGQVFAAGKSLPLLVSGQDASKSGTLEIDVTLTSSAGQSVWHQRTAATLNEQSGIVLPADLAPGLYRLDLVLYSGGEVAQKKSASFFVAKEGWRLTGIRSFPPVIATAATVMLKAELEIPAGSDAYLRWSWKGKVIARGMQGNGYDQIIWVVPPDSGVYTITLELFPSAPPAGSDFPFTSSLALSTDVVVSGAAGSAYGDLAQDASYLSLLRLQASLADTGSGAKKAGRAKAIALGAPEVVTLDNRFGYRLDGSSGIQVPWLALPLQSGSLKPFTISVGISLDNPVAAKRLVNAATADGSFSLDIEMDPQSGGPQARITGTGAPPVLIPWPGQALAAKQRYLLSLSIVPQSASLAAQWFLDGTQVGAASVRWQPVDIRQEGTLTIGGQGGFAGLVDEFGVYVQDNAGRPSTDPGLYARAQALAHSSSLVIADGFDGIYLPDGFALKGKGQIAEGSLSLSPGARIDLPPISSSDSAIAVSVDLADDSARAATLVLTWEGASAAALTLPLAADSTGLRIRVGPQGTAVIVPSGGSEKTVAVPVPEIQGANLLASFENPPDAKSALIIDQVLATKAK
jgi:hypothetical protein